MKILIVEDNPLNLKLATDILKHAGHTIISAQDADTGIKKVKTDMPDLVLMDIQLPGKDGLTATRILKSDDATKGIKVIALTACAMQGDEARALEAGCDGYITKPIRYKEFLAAIDKTTKTIGNQ